MSEASRTMSSSPLPVQELRRRLLRWYDAVARELPWRGVRDPYAVWVSEVMLQQTRVDTVRDYYERFMRRFPTPEALAQASEDEVLASWSGLGYYRRARLLHQGVRDVVARYGGVVPEDPEARRALPGVGRYTAGAIGSIAYQRPEPVVDGNVARVLARLGDIDSALESATTQRRLWAMAEELVRGPRPGDFNQALMELGATLCTPSAPGCDECPWRGRCQALDRGTVEARPVRRPKRAPALVKLTALAASRGGTVWLERAEGTLYGGLWNLPMREGHGRARARALLAEHGIDATLARRPLAEHVHTLTHRRLQVQLWRADARAVRGARLRRCDLTALHTLGLSQLTRRLLELSVLGRQDA